MTNQQRETMRAEFVVWCADHMQISIAEVSYYLENQTWTDAEAAVGVRWEAWKAALATSESLKPVAEVVSGYLLYKTDVLPGSIPDGTQLYPGPAVDKKL